jgi:hypothetical protein
MSAADDIGLKQFGRGTRVAHTISLVHEIFTAQRAVREQCKVVVWKQRHPEICST